MPTAPAPASGTPAAWELSALIGLLLVAAALRLPALDRYPPGMSQDELIRGYDAWSLWETGRDVHGVRWPAYFEAFGPGDYPAASSAWLTAPLVGWFGLSEAVVRLPIALSALLAIALVWRWVRREWGATAALAATASLALSPWHLLVSRMAFEGLLTPCLLTIGLSWLVRSRDAGSRVGGVVAGAALGVAMWTYAAPRFIVPVVLAAWWAIRLAQSRRTVDAASSLPPRRVGWLLAGLLIGAAPMLLTLATHPEHVFARARYIASVGRQDLPATLTRSAIQYLRHFDPRYLCRGGDDIAQFLMYRYRFIHMFELPLLLIGVYWIVRQARRSPPAALLLVWLLLFPIPAALADDLGPHYIRSILGIPLLSILVGIGAAHMLTWTGRRAAWLPAATAVLLGGAAAFSATRMVRHYFFGEFPRDYARVYPTDLAAAFRWLGEARPAYDAAFVLVPRNQTWAFCLFHAGIDPQSIQQAGLERLPWVQGFTHVLRAGNIWFCPPPKLDPDWASQQAPRLLAAMPPGSRVLLFCLPGQLDNPTPPLATITDAAGNPAIVVYQVVTQGL